MQTELTRQPSHRPPALGIVARLANTFDMDPKAFEQTLVATIFPSGRARKEEVAALCMVADKFQLDPIAREIYAFPNKVGGITPIISVDGWYKLANRHPEMDGLTFEEIEDPNDPSKPLKVIARLYRKDRTHPFEISERYSECHRNTGPWNTQPYRMLRHRAGIQAIRVAFGIAALDPDEAERIPEYEIQTAKAQGRDPEAPPRMDDEAVAAELGEKYADVPPEEPPQEQVDTETGEVNPPEAEAAQPKTERKRRSRAVAEQKKKFASAMSRGWIDPGLISSHLPEEDEDIEGRKPEDDTLEEAFAIMWKDDAEVILERIRTGEFKPAPRDDAEAAPAASEPPEDSGGVPQEHDPGMGQGEFPV